MAARGHSAGMGFLRNGIGIAGGYLVAFYIEHLFRYLAAKGAGLVATFSWKGVEFHASSAEWHACDCVIITYLGGPLLLLILGAAVLTKLGHRLRRGGKLHPLLVWFMIFALTRFLGGFIAGWLTHDGLWYVLSWAYLPNFMQLIIGVVTLLALLPIAFKVRKYYLLNERMTISILENKQYLPFVFMRMVLPYLIIFVGLLLVYWSIGSYDPFIFTLYGIFLLPYDLYIFIISGIFLLPVVLGRKLIHRQQFIFPESA